MAPAAASSTAMDTVGCGPRLKFEPKRTNAPPAAELAAEEEEEEEEEEANDVDDHVAGVFFATDESSFSRFVWLACSGG